MAFGQRNYIWGNTMTCNNVFLTQPEAEGSISYTIPEGDSARLNFGPQDISGLRLGDNGELIISFEDGGQLTITNFEELSGNGSLLYLSDGTLVDPSILTSSLQLPSALNGVEAAAVDSDAILITQPGENTTQEMSLAEGQKYICNFDPTNAAVVEIKDGQMVLTFADGSQVIINNFSEVMAGELPPELTIADGNIVEGEDLLTTVTELEKDIEETLEVAEESSDGENVANIEPAAGDETDMDMAALAEQIAEIQPAAGEEAGVSNSGYGFGSMPSSDPLGSPDAIGPLGATALNYTAPQAYNESYNAVHDDRPGFNLEPTRVDETNLVDGTLVATGNVHAHYGNDGPGHIETNGSFHASHELVDGVLSSHGVPIVVTQTEDGQGYIGVAGDVEVFEFTINPSTGSYTYTQYEPLDHGNTNQDNEDIYLDFGVTAEDADGDRTPANVRIYVADDAPLVTEQTAEAVDETNMDNGVVSTSGQFHAEFGSDGDGSYAATGIFEAAGSITEGSLTSHGEAVEVEFDPNTSTYTGTANGGLVFTLVLNSETGEFTYTQHAPLDHADGANPNDVIVLNFGASITDYDGDTETGTITINVLDDAPVVIDAYNSVDETNLGSERDHEFIADSINIHSGSDGIENIIANGNFDFNGSTATTLTSGNLPITVSLLNSGQYIGTVGEIGSPNYEIVFDFEIDSNGNYTFGLFGALDHADSNDPNDSINLEFGISTIDFDGDATNSTVTITVFDDGPIATSSSAEVDESNFEAHQTLTTEGQLDVLFRADGLNVEIDSSSVEFLDANEQPIDIGSISLVEVPSHESSAEYNGVGSDGQIFFTIEVGTNGQYSYRQHLPFEHPNSSDSNDVIIVHFPAIFTDGDGDSAIGDITISVYDDGPDASDDSLALGRQESTGSGNILDNDSAGADGEADQYVTNIEWHSGDVRATGVPLPDGSLSIHGNYGTLIINPDGAYTYTRSGRAGGTDRFDYTIHDSDGDQDTATLNIHVATDHTPIDISGSGETDDTALANGADVETGIINVNHQGDGLGETTGNGNFSSGSNQLNGSLTHDGATVNVTFNASNNTYTGTAGNLTVFSMVINANGTYQFTQFENLDHSDAGSNNEAITLNFGVQATDADGDTGTGNVRILVRDDGPTAHNDSAGSTGRTSNVNVLSNDDVGSDDADTEVLSFVHNGTTYDLSNGPAVIDLGNGSSFTIGDDGGAEFTARDNTSSGQGNTSTSSTRTDSVTVTYTMRDADGDTSTAQVTLSGRYTHTTLSTPPIVWGDGGDGGDGLGSGDGFGDGGGGTPLVLDLDGDGVEMTTTRDGVRFDMGSDGDLDLVAWVESDDGLLARDVNQDGQINDQSELFGTLDNDGFHVLADHDSNNDGVIDANDDIFDELLVWQDHNQDGISQDGELKTLSDLGITSINLAATMTDQYIEGSWNAYNSTFTYEDGSTGQISDVWFKYIDEGVWNRLVEGMGEEAATEWLANAYSTVTEFIPSEVNDDWQAGDPLVLGSTHKVFEIGLNDSIITQDGDLTVFYNGDEPGNIEGNGAFHVGGSLLNGALTSHGNEVTVTYDSDAGIYFGSTENSMVFNLQVNSDGSYTFHLFEGLDHGNNVNLDDNILLQFGVTVSDNDGDSTDSAIRIQLRDAGSYGSDDLTDDGVDIDEFGIHDATLFQAIDEASSIMESLNDAEETSLDISQVVGATDDITASIEDFVYANETNSEDSAGQSVEDNATLQTEVDGISLSSDIADIPDIVSDGSIVI